MSKELRGKDKFWQLPAVLGSSSMHTDTQTDGWLLTRVASRIDTDPHKLRQFANLLGIDDDTYGIIQQAQDTGQGLPLNVSSPSFIPCAGADSRFWKRVPLS